MQLVRRLRRLRRVIKGIMWRRLRSLPVAIRPRVQIVTCEGEPHREFVQTRRGRTLSVVRKPLITQGAKVFAMGSCFAVEIRNELRRLGFSVYPKYFDIEFDPTRQKIAKLPERDNVNHYNTFSIRQEFEIAFGRYETSLVDFWEVPAATPDVPGFGRERVFQDPHRVAVFGATADDLLQVSRKIDRCIREAVLAADVLIVTLGLTEVRRYVVSGRYLCNPQTAGHRDQVERIVSDFASNLENMRVVCSLLRENTPDKQVILTVSPVPLLKTFRQEDVLVANMESKAILRAVAGQIAREFPFVTYWPSFEIASAEDMFAPDGRHVTPAGVSKIMKAFVAAHVR